MWWRCSSPECIVAGVCVSTCPWSQWILISDDSHGLGHFGQHLNSGQVPDWGAFAAHATLHKVDQSMEK